MGEFILNGRNYGGSIITPNPSDTPTDTLDSVKINDTTYEIQGGGGGGANLILDATIFSMTEKQVGLWIDNKPLYQCTEHVILSTPIEPSTETSVTLSSFSNAERVFNISVLGGYKGSNSVVSTFVPFMEQSYIHTASDKIITNWNKTLMKVQSGSNYANFPSAGVDNRFREFYVTVLYTKTTDTAGSGGYQAYGFSPIIYSDVEREVGVWSDNKPLYKKTFFLDLTVTDNAWTHYLLGTTGIDIKDVEGYFSLSSIGNKIPFSYYRSSNEYFTWYTERNNEDIAVRPNMNAGTSVIVKYVTIIYTKNSDIAGSGEYNTLAIPNVHYSTDEQVIGTWVDGKTLYEKMFVFKFSDLGNSTIDNTKQRGNYALPQLNYGKIWLHDGYMESKPSVEGGGGTVKSSPLNYATTNGAYTRTNIQRNTTFNDTYPYIFFENTYAASDFYSLRNSIKIYAIVRYTKTTD